MTSDKTIKNRRYINLRPNQVEGILPEYFSTNYPQFISLLEKYYEFQDQSDSTELLKHLFATRDINETDILLLKYIEDELLLGEAYFEGFGETDAELRAAANFSNVLFRSKGTKFAIEWFFRSFYGVDAEVVYPKENIFKVGNSGSTIGVSSQHYLTNDTLYQTYALLIKSEIPISKWEDVFKLFAHPAGMYLGGEVQITADIENELRSLLFSESVTTPSYSISITPSTNEDEGTTFTANVSEGDSDTALFWYIVNLTTDSDDFGYVIADSTSPNYVDMPSGSGTFDVITTLDTDEAEGSESFNIIVKDEEGRLKSSSTITLQNVVATYSLTSDSSTYDEGETIDFTVTGTNVPNNGNIVLDYYVDHITTSDSDFVFGGSPPLTGSPNQVQLLNSVGTFSLDTRIDNVSDDGEQFKVLIRTPIDAMDRDSATITLNNVDPTFNVTASNLVEGNNLLVSVECDSVQIGNSVEWSITGAASSDSRVPSTSGSFSLTGINDQYTLLTTSVDPAYQGSVVGTVTVTSSEFYTPDITGNDTFTITDADPEYQLSVVPESGITFGDSAAFFVGGTNIPDGVVYYYIEDITTTGTDFKTPPPREASRDPITMSGGSGGPVFIGYGEPVIASDWAVNLHEYPFGFSYNSEFNQSTATPYVPYDSNEATWSVTASPDWRAIGLAHGFGSNSRLDQTNVISRIIRYELDGGKYVVRMNVIDNNATSNVMSLCIGSFDEVFACQPNLSDPRCFSIKTSGNSYRLGTYFPGPDASVPSTTSGDHLYFFIDLDNKEITINKNGTTNYTAMSTTGLLRFISIGAQRSGDNNDIVEMDFDPDLSGVTVPAGTFDSDWTGWNDWDEWQTKHSVKTFPNLISAGWTTETLNGGNSISQITGSPDTNNAISWLGILVSPTYIAPTTGQYQYVVECTHDEIVDDQDLFTSYVRINGVDGTNDFAKNQGTSFTTEKANILTYNFSATAGDSIEICMYFSNGNDERASVANAYIVRR